MLVISLVLCYNPKMTVGTYRYSQMFLGGEIEEYERKS